MFPIITECAVTADEDTPASGIGAVSNGPPGMCGILAANDPDTIDGRLDASVVMEFPNEEAVNDSGGSGGVSSKSGGGGSYPKKLCGRRFNRGGVGCWIFGIWAVLLIFNFNNLQIWEYL